MLSDKCILHIEVGRPSTRCLTSLKLFRSVILTHTLVHLFICSFVRSLQSQCAAIYGEKESNVVIAFSNKKK